MRIDLPGGAFLETTEGRTPFHKRIVRMKLIRGRKNQRRCWLECGHVVLLFGDINICLPTGSRRVWRCFLDGSRAGGSRKMLRAHR